MFARRNGELTLVPPRLQVRYCQRSKGRQSSVARAPPRGVACVLITNSLDLNVPRLAANVPRATARVVAVDVEVRAAGSRSRITQDAVRLLHSRVLNRGRDGRVLERADLVL